MTVPALGIVADDLTGAMDTASGVATRGYETAVVAVPEGRSPETSVVALNTESRYAEPAAAADAVRAAVDGLGASVTYKKVDSTLRGNVACEVVAALRATGAALALVAPAFPATGRRTRDGVHRVEGTPVAETEYGADANGPTTSTLADLFAGHGHPIERVATTDIEAGPDRAAAVLAEAVDRHDRPPIVVCDAHTDAHLATVATAGSRCDTLYVGSSGLAAQLDVHAPRDADRTPPTPGPGAPLAVVGSASPRTFAQLERVPDDRLVVLSPRELLGGEAGQFDEVADRLARGAPTVLTGATDHAAVERTLAAGRERGLAPAAIRERVAAALAGTAATAVREAPPSGLFYTGGDVALAGLRALGATTVSLSGTTVASGIPVGQLVDGAVAGRPLITKAGGFGGEGAIVNCLALLDGER